MATIYDVDSSELINKAASSLKNNENIKEPSWAKFVKTSAARERPPVEKDWWYARTASILRKVYVLGPIGVNKLRVKYGGKKNRGHKPEHFYLGSGNIIRKVLQQLEKAELIKYAEKGVHKGRIVTPKGKKFLDGIANEIIGNSTQVQKPKVEKKHEVKKVEKVPSAHELLEKKKPKETKKIIDNYKGSSNAEGKE